MLDFVGTLGYRDIVGDHEKLLEIIRTGKKDQVVPILSAHLNAGLARMGNLIREDYQNYFVQDEADKDYWVQYNRTLLKGRE